MNPNNEQACEETAARSSAVSSCKMRMVAKRAAKNEFTGDSRRSGERCRVSASALHRQFDRGFSRLIFCLLCLAVETWLLSSVFAADSAQNIGKKSDSLSARKNLPDNVEVVWQADLDENIVAVYNRIIRDYEGFDGFGSDDVKPAEFYESIINSFNTVSQQSKKFTHTSSSNSESDDTGSRFLCRFEPPSLYGEESYNKVEVASNNEVAIETDAEAGVKNTQSAEQYDDLPGYASQHGNQLYRYFLPVRPNATPKLDEIIDLGDDDEQLATLCDSFNSNCTPSGKNSADENADDVDNDTTHWRNQHRVALAASDAKVHAKTTVREADFRACEDSLFCHKKFHPIRGRTLLAQRIFANRESSFGHAPMNKIRFFVVRINNSNTNKVLRIYSAISYAPDFHCVGPKEVAPGNSSFMLLAFTPFAGGYRNTTVELLTSVGVVAHAVTGFATISPTTTSSNYVRAAGAGAYYNDKVPFLANFTQPITVMNLHLRDINVISAYTTGGPLHLTMPCRDGPLDTIPLSMTDDSSSSPELLPNDALWAIPSFSERNLFNLTVGYPPNRNDFFETDHVRSAVGQDCKNVGSSKCVRRRIIRGFIRVKYHFITDSESTAASSEVNNNAPISAYKSRAPHHHRDGQFVPERNRPDAPFNNTKCVQALEASNPALNVAQRQQQCCYAGLIRRFAHAFSLNNRPKLASVTTASARQRAAAVIAANVVIANKLHEYSGTSSYNKGGARQPVNSNSSSERAGHQQESSGKADMSAEFQRETTGSAAVYSSTSRTNAGEVSGDGGELSAINDDDDDDDDGSKSKKKTDHDKQPSSNASDKLAADMELIPATRAPTKPLPQVHIHMLLIPFCFVFNEHPDPGLYSPADSNGSGAALEFAHVLYEDTETTLQSRSVIAPPPSPSVELPIHYWHVQRVPEIGRGESWALGQAEVGKVAVSTFLPVSVSVMTLNVTVDSPLLSPVDVHKLPHVKSAVFDRKHQFLFSSGNSAAEDVADAEVVGDKQSTFSYAAASKTLSQSELKELEACAAAALTTRSVAATIRSARGRIFSDANGDLFRQSSPIVENSNGIPIHFMEVFNDDHYDVAPLTHAVQVSFSYPSASMTDEQRKNCLGLLASASSAVIRAELNIDAISQPQPRPVPRIFAADNGIFVARTLSREEFRRPTSTIEAQMYRGKVYYMQSTRFWNIPPGSEKYADADSDSLYIALRTITLISTFSVNVSVAFTGNARVVTPLSSSADQSDADFNDIVDVVVNDEVHRSTASSENDSYNADFAGGIVTLQSRRPTRFCTIGVKRIPDRFLRQPLQIELEALLLVQSEDLRHVVTKRLIAPLHIYTGRLSVNATAVQQWTAGNLLRGQVAHANILVSNRNPVAVTVEVRSPLTTTLSFQITSSGGGGGASKKKEAIMSEQPDTFSMELRQNTSGNLSADYRVRVNKFVLRPQSTFSILVTAMAPNRDEFIHEELIIRTPFENITIPVTFRVILGRLTLSSNNENTSPSQYAVSAASSGFSFDRYVTPFKLENAPHYESKITTQHVIRLHSSFPTAVIIHDMYFDDSHDLLLRDMKTGLGSVARSNPLYTCDFPVVDGRSNPNNVVENSGANFHPIVVPGRSNNFELATLNLLTENVCWRQGIFAVCGVLRSRLGPTKDEWFRDVEIPSGERWQKDARIMLRMLAEWRRFVDNYNATVKTVLVVSTNETMLRIPIRTLYQWPTLLSSDSFLIGDEKKSDAESSSAARRESEMDPYRVHDVQFSDTAPGGRSIVRLLVRNPTADIVMLQILPLLDMRLRSVYYSRSGEPLPKNLILPPRQKTDPAEVEGKFTLDKRNVFQIRAVSHVKMNGTKSNTTQWERFSEVPRSQYGSHRIKLFPFGQVQLDVAFVPRFIGSYSTNIVIRNNLTVFDVVHVAAKCLRAHVMYMPEQTTAPEIMPPIFVHVKRYNGSITEVNHTEIFHFNQLQASQCGKLRSPDRNFRDWLAIKSGKFRVMRHGTFINRGQLKVHIKRITIDGKECENKYFTVHNGPCGAAAQKRSSVGAAVPALSNFTLLYSFSPQFDRTVIIHEMLIFLAEVDESAPVSVVLVGMTPENIVRECRDAWPPAPNVERFYAVAAVLMFATLLGITVYAYAGGRSASAASLKLPLNRRQPGRVFDKNSGKTQQPLRSNGVTALPPYVVLTQPRYRYPAVAYIRDIFPWPWDVVRLPQRLKSCFVRTAPRHVPSSAPTTTTATATLPINGSKNHRSAAILRSLSNKHYQQQQQQRALSIVVENLERRLQSIGAVFGVVTPRFVLSCIFKRAPVFLWQMVVIHCIRFVSRMVTRQLLGYGVVSRNGSSNAIASLQRKRSILLAQAAQQKEKESTAAGRTESSSGDSVKQEPLTEPKNQNKSSPTSTHEKCTSSGGRRSRNEQRRKTLPQKSPESKSSTDSGRLASSSKSRQIFVHKQSAGKPRSGTTSEVTAAVANDESDSDPEDAEDDDDVAVDGSDNDAEQSDVFVSEAEADTSLDNANDVDKQSQSDARTSASSSPFGLEKADESEEAVSRSPSVSPLLCSPAVQAILSKKSTQQQQQQQQQQQYLVQHDENVIRIPLDNNKTIVLKVETKIQADGSNVMSSSSLTETLAHFDQKTRSLLKAAVAADHRMVGKITAENDVDDGFKLAARTRRGQRTTTRQNAEAAAVIQSTAAGPNANNNKRGRTKSHRSTSSTKELSVNGSGKNGKNADADDTATFAAAIAAACVRRFGSQQQQVDAAKKNARGSATAAVQTAANESSNPSSSSYYSELIASLENKNDGDDARTMTSEQLYEQYLFQQWKKHQQLGVSKHKIERSSSNFNWLSPPPSDQHQQRKQLDDASPPPPRYGMAPTPPHHSSSIFDSLAASTTNRNDAGDATQNGFVAVETTDNIWGSNEPLYARSFFADESGGDHSAMNSIGSLLPLISSPRSAARQQQQRTSHDAVASSSSSTTLFGADLPWAVPLSPMLPVNGADSSTRSSQFSSLFGFGAESGRSVESSALSFSSELRALSATLGGAFEGNDAANSVPPSLLWPSMDGLDSFNSNSASETPSLLASPTKLFAGNTASTSSRPQHHNTSVIGGSRSLLSRMSPRILSDSNVFPLPLSERQLLQQPAQSVSPLVIAADDYFYVPVDTKDEDDVGETKGN